MSEQLAFKIFVVLAVLAGTGLFYLNRWNEAKQRELTSKDLETNLAIWKKADISSYDFSIVQHGSWVVPPPMRIAVRDGVVTSAIFLCLPPHTAEQCKFYEGMQQYSPGQLISQAKTIPQFFDIISTTVSTWGAGIQLEFDPAYGFPTRYDFDIPNARDEEFGFEISEFSSTH